MEDSLKLYQDIANRTDGDIYVGVVGPVRTGKSTFIKNFMDLLVIPNIDNSYKRERAVDELPQSAAGRTIMTTEPKFVPNEAAEITLNGNITFKTRLVDCVGYLVNNAIGYMEDNIPRMVKTPWFDEEIPFEEAAEIGTKKVIEDHSTIGILITTDGSFSGINRDDYILAEERVANELKSLNKPFVIVLNTAFPNTDETAMLTSSLEEKYGVSVIPTDCSNLSFDDINNIFGKVLYEFPYKQVNLKYAKWIDALDNNHWLKKEMFNEIKNNFADLGIIKEVYSIADTINSQGNLLANTTTSNSDNSTPPNNTNIVTSCNIEQINLGTGNINLSLDVNPALFYKVLTEMSGTNVSNEYELFSTFSNFAKIKQKYDKIGPAIEEVNSKGYGIITPSIDDLILDEPEMVKQGTKYGVKLKAKAPSIHLIKTDVETEVSPIVGSEKQSEDLVKYLLSEFENDPTKIWESNIFGKSLHSLVNEGLQNKLACMPEDAQVKLQQTLERIVNEGSGGLICIIL